MIASITQSTSFSHLKIEWGLVRKNRKFYEVMTDKVRIYRLIGHGHEKIIIITLHFTMSIVNLI